jgi:predicted nucleic acid-binding protein
VRTLVLDANMGLALVVPLPYSERVQDLFQEWHDQGAGFAVPALWGYEVDSGLRKAVVSGVLTEAEADAALQSLWALDIQEIPATLDHHTRALAWAKLLNQTVAYDAQYTVVAEELQAPLWTADRRLADAARSAGAEWVHWIGDRT